MTETEGFASEPEPVLFPELGDPPAPDESLVTVRRDDLRRILTQPGGSVRAARPTRRTGWPQRCWIGRRPAVRTPPEPRRVR